MKHGFTGELEHANKLTNFHKFPKHFIHSIILYQTHKSHKKIMPRIEKSIQLRKSIQEINNNYVVEYILSQHRPLAQVKTFNSLKTRELRI